MSLLAGDVGGTKTRLAIYDRAGDAFELRHMAVYESSASPTLETVVQAFLGEHPPAQPIEAACFGIPGPVVRGLVRTTNLPWVLEERSLAANLNVPKIRLVNDLAATAAALPLLGPADLITLHPGLQEREREVYAVVAPGTGLGQAFLIRGADGRYHPFPTEGGHVEFAPKDELEFDLLTYLQSRLRKRVSVERVLSGPGILNIYAFFRERRNLEEPEALREEIASRTGPGGGRKRARAEGDHTTSACRRSTSSRGCSGRTRAMPCSPTSARAGCSWAAGFPRNWRPNCRRAGRSRPTSTRAGCPRWSP